MSTETLKLDRKRSFGTVYNDPNIGFVQDERYFRADGTLYISPEPTLKGDGVKSVGEVPVASELLWAVNKLTQKLDGAEAPRRDVLTRSGVHPGK